MWMDVDLMKVEYYKEYDAKVLLIIYISFN